MSGKKLIKGIGIEIKDSDGIVVASGGVIRWWREWRSSDDSTYLMVEAVMPSDNKKKRKRSKPLWRVESLK